MRQFARAGFVLGLLVSACGQVAGLGEEYTVADGGDDGGNAGTSTSSGAPVDSGASGSSSSSGAASSSSGAASSSSGNTPVDYCALPAFKNTASSCAKCVVKQSDCKLICDQSGGGAKLYLDCLRTAGDKATAFACTNQLDDAGEQQTQRTCILSDCQQECPLASSSPGG